MTLLIDAGNTRFKWASSERPADVQVSEYHEEDKAASLIRLLRDRRPCGDVLICSVLGPEFRETLTAWATPDSGCTIDFVETRAAACGVEVAYQQPQNLGADRYCALIAAHAHYPGNRVIVDCGTAVTLDALRADGKHLGGLILPGLLLMRRSLSEQTMEIGGRRGADAHLFARDTHDAVCSGTLRAVTAAIERIAGDMAAALSDPVARILCGGDGAAVAATLGGEWRLDPFLVTRGLAILAKE